MDDLNGRNLFKLLRHCESQRGFVGGIAVQSISDVAEAWQALAYNILRGRLTSNSGRWRIDNGSILHGWVALQFWSDNCLKSSIIIFCFDAEFSQDLYFDEILLSAGINAEGINLAERMRDVHFDHENAALDSFLDSFKRL